MSAYEHFYQYFDGCSGKCTEFRGQINWSAQPNYNKTVTFCLCCIFVCNHYSWYSNGQSCKNYKNCLCPGCKKIKRIVKPNFCVNNHGDNTKLSLNNCSYLLKIELYVQRRNASRSTMRVSRISVFVRTQVLHWEQHGYGYVAVKIGHKKYDFGG